MLCQKEKWLITIIQCKQRILKRLASLSFASSNLTPQQSSLPDRPTGLWSFKRRYHRHDWIWPSWKMTQEVSALETFNKYFIHWAWALDFYTKHIQTVVFHSFSHPKPWEFSPTKVCLKQSICIFSSLQNQINLSSTDFAFNFLIPNMLNEIVCAEG